MPACRKTADVQSCAASSRCQRCPSASMAQSNDGIDDSVDDCTDVGMAISGCAACGAARTSGLAVVAIASAVASTSPCTRSTRSAVFQGAGSTSNRSVGFSDGTARPHSPPRSTALNSVCWCRTRPRNQGRVSGTGVTLASITCAPRPESTSHRSPPATKPSFATAAVAGSTAGKGSAAGVLGTGTVSAYAFSRSMPATFCSSCAGSMGLTR